MLFGGETAQSYYEEGLTAAIKGNLPFAENCFKQALQLDAQLYNAQYQLGKCLLRMGQPLIALKHLQLAEAHLPALIFPKIESGYALLLLNKVEEARNSFSEALQIKANDPRAVMGLARCAEKEQQWGTVVGLTQHAIELNYSHFDTHLLLAYASDQCNEPEIAQRNYGQAIELMDQSIDANPEQPTGYYLRGKTYFFQEHFSAALSDFETALEKADKNTHYAAYNDHFTILDILCMQGHCQELSGKNEEASGTGERILELAPDNEIGKRLITAAKQEQSERPVHD